MRYHDGELRTKKDSCFWKGADFQKGKLTCVEYLPIVVLGILMVGLFLLMENIFF